MSNFLTVALVSTTFGTTSTSASAGSAIDLSNYFPVGRREVKFVVAAYNQSTIALTIDIQQCASTATASFTNCFLAGTTSTAETTTSVGTTVAGITTVFEQNVQVDYRYVRLYWAQAASTDTGKYSGITGVVIPRQRAS